MRTLVGLAGLFCLFWATASLTLFGWVNVLGWESPAFAIRHTPPSLGVIITTVPVFTKTPTTVVEVVRWAPSTPTTMPKPTDTVVPTATETPLPAPTNTPVPVPTDTPVPAPLPTDTPVPVPATDTPVPVPPTDTPVPPTYTVEPGCVCIETSPGIVECDCDCPVSLDCGG